MATSSAHFSRSALLTVVCALSPSHRARVNLVVGNPELSHGMVDFALGLGQRKFVSSTHLASTDRRGNVVRRALDLGCVESSATIWIVASRVLIVALLFLSQLLTRFPSR